MNLTFFAITLEWGIIFALLVIASIAAIRVGIFCLAVESIFLNTAAGFILGFAMTNSFLIGLVIGSVVGTSTAFFFFLFVVVLRLEEIVTGLGLNMLSFGVSSFAIYCIKGQKFISISLLANIKSQLILVIPALVVSVAIFFVLDKSFLKTRLIAVGQSPEIAKISNISVLRYRALGIALTGIAATTAGLYCAYIQSQFHIAQWNEGLGFLALGVAFASRGSLEIGVIVAFALAFFRTLSLMDSLPKWIPAPDALLPALPYVLVLFFIAFLSGLFKKKTKVFSI